VPAAKCSRRATHSVPNEQLRSQLRLLAHAQIIRAETVNAARTIEAFRRGQRRQLHIGAMTAHPLVQFAEAIIEFVQEEPNLFLRITHGSPEELMDLMRQGTLEMVFGPLLSGPEATGLVQDTIYYDKVNIYCSRKNAFAHGGMTKANLPDASSIVCPPPLGRPQCPRPT
jgi:DNA-binding transcriptional LysR family regulator